jgi:hypothetical protein
VFIIIIAHLFLGGLWLPALNGLPLSAWIIGPLTLLLAALTLLISWRSPRRITIFNRFSGSSFWNNLFSLQWLYSFIRMSYIAIARIFALFSTILEGDGGILWALVLFALIFVFLQQR